jgi:hypothetical protein
MPCTTTVTTMTAMLTSASVLALANYTPIISPMPPFPPKPTAHLR